MKKNSQLLFLLFALTAIWVGCQTKDMGWSPLEVPVLLTSNKDGNSNIYLFDPMDSIWTKLTSSDASNNWAVWSPSGDQIVFQSRKSGNLDIWAMDRNGSNIRQLTDHAAHDYLPGWTPDGAGITFTSWRKEEGDESSSAHIYIMNADGSNERRLLSESLNTSSGASWASDGQSFVFSRKTGEKGADVFIADKDGQVLQRLTEDTLYCGAPAFAPDGRHIAYYSDNGKHSDIVILTVETLERRLLVSGGQNWYPRWSPDGQWIIYTAAKSDGAEQNLALFAVSAAGGDPVEIVDTAAREAEGSWNPAP